MWILILPLERFNVIRTFWNSFPNFQGKNNEYCIIFTPTPSFPCRSFQNFDACSLFLQFRAIQKQKKNVPSAKDCSIMFEERNIYKSILRRHQSAPCVNFSHIIPIRISSYIAHLKQKQLLKFHKIIHLWAETSTSNNRHEQPLTFSPSPLFRSFFPLLSFWILGEKKCYEPCVSRILFASADFCSNIACVSLKIFS